MTSAHELHCILWAPELASLGDREVTRNTMFTMDEYARGISAMKKPQSFGMSCHYCCSRRCHCS